VTDPFAVRFAAARDTLGPLVLGADPHGPVLRAWGLTDDADGLERFTDIVLAAASGAVGLVKPQSAFYERHGWRGVRALTRLTETARAPKPLVILDVKRGDVGSTNEAYAQAYLGADAPVQADAITVHPYLGLAAMGAFVERAHHAGGCLLVVTRSSAVVGPVVSPGPADPGPADPPLDLAAASRALFLVPGLGAQGATPQDVARTFAACPGRVMPSASRSLLAAGPDPGALRDAAASLNAELRALL
jgi:orotidine-5'-phosphate decarboxylase